jgi:hypothetical protein
MDKYEIENWEKIKTHLESVGKTDNMFYKRAKAISETAKDPMEKPPSFSHEESE